VLVLAGPSGVGKGRIGQLLRERRPDLRWSVSATTRPPRAGEVDGDDYFFMTREGFERLRDSGGFLEWFEVYGDLKGTPRRPVEEARSGDHDLLVEVDVQGALAIKDAVPEAVLVFVKPPSREEQIRRLQERGADDPDALARRLEAAAAEEALAGRFDHVVVNDDLDRAVDEVAGILDNR
jgi:guanylate kinase